MLLPFDGLSRFCSDCCQQGTESNPATWSDRFGARLCMDCYNIRCEAIESEYMATADSDD